MAAANPLTAYCDLNFVKTSHFKEANAVAVGNSQFEVITEFSVEFRRRNETIKSEIEVKMWKVIRSLFLENSKFVQTIHADPSCVPHSSILEKNRKLRLINSMKCSSWHSSGVESLLNFLFRNKNDFSLVIGFWEDEPSNNNDLRHLEFCFTWYETGFVCIVMDSNRGYSFSKDLKLVHDPTNRDYYLVSEKQKDLCIVMDGDQIQFVRRHDDSFITVWHYTGNELDPASRHVNSPGVLTVFGFKLTSKNSDTAKCLGAVNSMTVGLMNSYIPPHGKVIPTKTDADHRFFYHSTYRGYSMFESTQFENHFLAVMDSEDESVSPSLYLKEIPSSEKQYSEEILFKMERK